MNRDTKKRLRQVRIIRSAKSISKQYNADLVRTNPIMSDTIADQLSDISYLPDFPIIVTAYTVTSHLGDYYQKATARLTRSCVKFNLPHFVIPLKSVTEWMNGCNLKPTVILYALHTFKRPVLWVDADAEIFKFPDIFSSTQFKADMAITAEKPPSDHWLSGTLYVKPEIASFVQKWRDYTPQSNFKDTDADEVTLRNLWHNHDTQTRPSIAFLPSEYNTVVHSQTDVSKLVIGHYIRRDIAPSRNCSAVPVPEL